jgi:transcriptional regulator with XRE-family HTH domain
MKEPVNTTYFFRAVEKVRGSTPLAEVGRIAGVNPNAVQDWKNKGAIPGFEKVERLAAHFGVSLDYFSERGSGGAAAPSGAKNAAGGAWWSGLKRFVNGPRGSDLPANVLLRLLEADLSAFPWDPSSDDDVEQACKTMRGRDGSLPARVDKQWAAALERNFSRHGFPSPPVVTQLYAMTLSVDVTDIDAAVAEARARAEEEAASSHPAGRSSKASKPRRR